MVRVFLFNAIAIHLETVCVTCSLNLIKAWPNARNISTQHLAKLLGTTCCMRLATLLQYVAICCNMLDDVGSNLKAVKFFVQHFGCCMMLYSFGHVHATFLHLGMRARSDVLRARGLGHINIDMLR